MVQHRDIVWKLTRADGALGANFGNGLKPRVETIESLIWFCLVNELKWVFEVCMGATPPFEGLPAVNIDLQLTWKRSHFQRRSLSPSQTDVPLAQQSSHISASACRCATAPLSPTPEWMYSLELTNEQSECDIMVMYLLDGVIWNGLHVCDHHIISLVSLIGFKMRSLKIIRRYILKIGYSQGDYQNYKESNKSRYVKSSHTN